MILLFILVNDGSDQSHSLLKWLIVQMIDMFKELLKILFKIYFLGLLL